MGYYNLIADEDSHDPIGTKLWVDEFNRKNNARAFLNNPYEQGKADILVSDNENSERVRLSDANKKQLIENVLARDGVRVSVRDAFARHSGYSQDVGGPRAILINVNAEKKSFLNILVHELGHKKWPGLGPESNHDPLFYRLLRDNLKALDLPIDREKDLRGYTDEQLNAVAPKNFDSLNYVRKRCDPLPDGRPSPDPDCGPKEAPKKKEKLKQQGEVEGLRELNLPKVVSITPSVNLTPMGGAVVPVPYTVVGYFDESVNTAQSVLFTKNRTFTMASYVREVHGDAPGSAGGIKSGTVSAKAEPIEHSSTVRAERFYVVRHDDLFYMNNRNTVGRAIFIV
jgi:hypothetical protein